MTVLVATPIAPDPRAPGAIPVLLDAAVRGLAARHAVTLVTAADADDESAQAALGALTRAGVDVRAVVMPATGRLRRAWRRARLAARWASGGWPRRSVWLGTPALEAAVARACTERHVDVVQLEDASLGACALPRGVPVVYTEHEVRRARPWRMPARGQRRRWRVWVDELDWQRWPRHQTAAWHRAGRIQVFSPRDAAAIAAAVPGAAARVRVNPFPIALPRLPDAQGPASDPDTLLFAGHFLHGPNVDAAEWLITDILPRVRLRRPGTRLLVVGPDPRGRVRALGSVPGVTVTGAVSDVGSLLQQAAVVVAPVRIGGGQRMKVLQGMAASRAVVTTSRGAEGVGAACGSGALVVADTAETLAASVVQLLEQPERGAVIGRLARAYVATHHSPEAYARRANAIYDELIRERKP